MFNYIQMEELTADTESYEYQYEICKTHYKYKFIIDLHMPEIGTIFLEY